MGPIRQPAEPIQQPTGPDALRRTGWIALAITALLLTSCASGRRFNRLAYGMSKAQVLSVVGEPDRTSHDSQIETWRFSYAAPFAPTVFRVLKFNLQGELVAWD